MSHLVSWLTDNLRNAATKCGAVGASVYVPTPWNEASPAALVHVGAEPLPEMTDVERAAAFAQHAEKGSETSSADPCVVRSQATEGCLVPIPMLAAHWRSASTDGSGSSAHAPQRRLADGRGALPIVGWLGLRFASPPGPLHLEGGWASLLEITSALASTYVCFYGIVTDPVTGLPGRAELQGTLRAEIERAGATGRPFSLIFIKLESLDLINQREGQGAGDAALRALIELLQRTLRSSDVVMRYGAATFALPLRDVTAEGALVVAGKIHHRLLQDREQGLACAMGIATIDGGDSDGIQPLDLMRRADQALGASCRDPHLAPVLWSADGGVAASEPLDPLLGVFTGQAEKDYRNMRLLWEVLQVLANQSGADLANAAVRRICSLFAATRAALLQPDDQQTLRLTAGCQRLPATSEPSPLRHHELTRAEHELNLRAFQSGESQYAGIENAGAGTPSPVPPAFALPLMVAGRTLGTLYLLSRPDARKLDRTDLPVLSGVATHLALALDREQLAAEQRARADAEKNRLRAEVERLQGAVQQSPLVFGSREMTRLLDTTRRAATTDATVLLTGESGTGKEMLAHALHTFSARHRKPLVIVDCGAIPASLMDSELFGRERGAYTGAERRSAGRLAQADSGTVFLDEIGELPLEVQAKLLRFVQERTVSMVGSTASQRIDVRIIAATNRVLEHEVESGRFREDLFHRLNVVRLRIPPLRERRDDIPLLARHFLEDFARQYGKTVRGFDADAEAALQQHRWSGNVRQLQNTILQAVVLTHGDRITLDDLRLPDDTGTVPLLARNEPAPVTAPNQNVGAWPQLREALQREISEAMASGDRPIGRWLASEVVQRAYDESSGVLARAASRTGLADTTFVRRLRQAQAEATHIRLPESWPAVGQAILQLLRDTEDQPRLADRIDDLLLELVLKAIPDRLSRAAALLDVSTPTLKRRMAKSA